VTRPSAYCESSFLNKSINNLKVCLERISQLKILVNNAEQSMLKQTQQESKEPKMASSINRQSSSILEEGTLHSIVLWMFCDRIKSKFLSHKFFQMFIYHRFKVDLKKSYMR
jgi:hypothetical protein